MRITITFAIKCTMNRSTYIGKVLTNFHNNQNTVHDNHDDEDVGGGDVHEADETEQSVQRDLVCLQNEARQLKQTQCCAAAAEVAWGPHTSQSPAENQQLKRLIRKTLYGMK